ncbi:MAG: hypothetical protein KF688_14075 [Pirellulales bacterium]|nr:hypothetical protein [Pirellulales bacterium]
MSAEALAHGRQGPWWIATTGNFQVCSLAGAAEAERTARRCEEIRAELIREWGFVEAEQRPWRPKCRIILHVTTQSYAAAVGTAYAATYGSSLTKPTTGPVQSRRIDLRTDVPNFLAAALPHELCHVLLADRHRETAAPLWYDEGIALLADPEAKQILHERDRNDGVRRGFGFTVSELVTARGYPTRQRMGVFYGQCAALTRYLRSRGSADQLHRFAVRCQEIGVNQAATECYGFESGRDLEQHWLESLGAVPAANVVRVLPVASAGAQRHLARKLP